MNGMDFLLIDTGSITHILQSLNKKTFCESIKAGLFEFQKVNRIDTIRNNQDRLYSELLAVQYYGYANLGWRDKSMNATIIHKPNVKGNLLDELSNGLPAIIAEEMQVLGGKLAILQPKQVSLEFTQASLRDVGSDIRIMVFARSNDPRTSTENDRAKAMLDKVIALIKKSDEKYSVDIRLYLLEIGSAEHSFG